MWKNNNKKCPLNGQWPTKKVFGVIHKPRGHLRGRDVLALSATFRKTNIQNMFKLTLYKPVKILVADTLYTIFGY